MDPKELRGLVEAYQQVNAPQEVDEAKQESDEEDWRKSEIRNLRRHRQTGTTTPYRDRLVSHTKGRGVKKEKGAKSVEEEYKSPNKKRIQSQSDAAYKKERRALDRGDSDEAMRQNRRRNAMNTPSTRRNELESKNRKEEFDIFDTILEHLIAEGYADTNEAAIAIMANMSEEWRDDILEQSAIAARAAKVVGDQRQGYAGDADAINKMQDATSKSIGRLKRGQGPVVTPGLPGV